MMSKENNTITSVKIITKDTLFAEGIKTLLSRKNIKPVEVLSDTIYFSKPPDLLPSANEVLICEAYPIGSFTLSDLQGHLDANRKIMLFCPEKNPIPVKKYMQAGVLSLVSKGISVTEFDQAWSMLLRKRLYISFEIKETLVRDAINGKTNQFESLTPREFDILMLLAHNVSMPDISKKFNIPPASINYHKNKIAMKLRLKSSKDLYRYNQKYFQPA